MSVCHFCKKIFRSGGYGNNFRDRRGTLRLWNDYSLLANSNSLHCSLCLMFRSDLLLQSSSIDDDENASIEFQYTHQTEDSTRQIPIIEIKLSSSFSTYTVKYRIFTDDYGPLSKTNNGRIVARDAASDTALARVSNLVGLHDSKCRCSTTHDLSFPLLPTRVLDLGLESKQPIIRLIESGDRCGHYAALSHCWGSARFMTTVSSLSERHEAIRIGDMPKTFQDAVTVTRRLGLRFLWIDSLCIIQWDPSKSEAENEPARKDFSMESSRMGDYYGNSYITIAADCSSDDADGFLRKRAAVHGELGLYSTYYDDQFKAFECNIDDQNLRIYLNKVNDHSGWNIPDMNREEDPLQIEALQTRAWALQERLLSDVIIHFGTKQNFLENHHTGKVKFEDGVTTRCFQYWEKLYKKENILPFQAWYSMIEDFKARSITKPSDTLPALSGLAQRVASISKDQYCAGLWRNDLTRGLLWKTSSEAGSNETGKQAISCTAPSWSWASALGRVSFWLNDLSNPVDPDTWYMGHDHDLDSKDHPLCTILDCQTIPSSTDPFAEVEGGYINMNAHCFQIQELKEHGALYYDTEKIPDNNSVFGVFIARVSKTDGKSRFNQKATTYGLLLQPMTKEPENHLFRRVGIFYAPHDITSLAPDIFKSTNRKTITIH